MEQPTGYPDPRKLLIVRHAHPDVPCPHCADLNAAAAEEQASFGGGSLDGWEDELQDWDDALADQRQRNAS